MFALKPDLPKIAFLAEAYAVQRAKLHGLLDRQQDPLCFILGHAIAQFDREALPKIRARLELELAVYRVMIQAPKKML